MRGSAIDAGFKEFSGKKWARDRNVVEPHSVPVTATVDLSRFLNGELQHWALVSEFAGHGQSDAVHRLTARVSGIVNVPQYVLTGAPTTPSRLRAALPRGTRARVPALGTRIVPL